MTPAKEPSSHQADRTAEVSDTNPTARDPATRPDSSNPSEERRRPISQRHPEGNL